MYNNNYSNPYSNPYQSFLQNTQHQNTQPQQSYQITNVSGENGAKAYSLPPNSSVLLVDSTAPLVWHKSTDGAGYPTLVAYEIKKRESATDGVKSDIENRIAKLEKNMEELVNAKLQQPAIAEPTASTAITSTEQPTSII